MKNKKAELREIITYHADDGTSGYLLSEEQINQILKWHTRHSKRKAEEVVNTLRELVAEGYTAEGLPHALKVTMKLE